MPHLSSLLLALALAGPAVSQSLDIAPAYHPDGTFAMGGRAIDFFAGEPMVVEASLPGLDHAQSQAVATSWVTFLAVAAAPLAGPVPLGGGAFLWLDPGTLQLFAFPPSLELPATLSSGAGGLALTFPAQVAAIDLGTAGFPLHTSDAFRLTAEPPPARPQDRMRPLGSTVPGATSVTFDAPSQTYHLRHVASAGGAVTEYVLDLTDQAAAKGSLVLDELSSGLRVLDIGGPYYVQGFGQGFYPPGNFQGLGQHVLEAHGISGKTVWLRWRDELPTFSGGGTVVRRRQHEFTLEGRSVEVHVFALDPPPKAFDNFAGLHLGGFSGAASWEVLHIPYLEQIGVVKLPGGWYHSTFVDLFRSNATLHTPALLGLTPGGARYTEVMTYSRADDLSVRPLDETGWVTVSRDLRDVFVESDAPASPHATDLAGKVGVTLGREANAGAYVADQANVARMVGWMFDEVFLFKFHWMRYGTNRRAPTHTPPNPVAGTESEFRSILSTALAAGWDVALYGDYFSLDQAQGLDDNPSYSETAGKAIRFEDALRDGNLDYRKGYGLAEDLTSGTSKLYNTRVLAPRRAFGHYEQEAKTFVDDYGSNAAYFDVMTISAPDLIVTGSGQNVGGAISLDHRSPSDRTIGEAIGTYKALFRAGSLRTGGPVVGEGSFNTFESRFDSLYAGYLDGVYRTISTGDAPAPPGKDMPILVDFELLVNHGRFTGFGMGQYARFFQGQLTQIPLPDVQLEEYRATEISYGHNGYILTSSTGTPTSDFLTQAQRVKEYYTMQGLAAEWTGATPVQIHYRAPGGGWLDVDAALAQPGFDFVHPVLRVRWSNGLEVVVNHATQTIGELGWQIPTHGWVARNASSGYENLAVLWPATGKLVHRVRSADYDLADGNGTSFDAGGLLGVTTDLVVVNKKYGKKILELPDTSVVVQ